MAGNMVAWCDSVVLNRVGADEADFVVGIVVVLSFTGFRLGLRFLGPQQGFFGTRSEFGAFGLLVVLGRAGVVAIPSSGTPSPPS